MAHDYSIEGYPPEKTITMNSKQDGVEHYIYVWTVPMKKGSEVGASEDDGEDDRKRAARKAEMLRRRISRPQSHVAELARLRTACR